MLMEKTIFSGMAKKCHFFDKFQQTASKMDMFTENCRAIESVV
jgi:hypothetical protein